MSLRTLRAGLRDTRSGIGRRPAHRTFLTEAFSGPITAISDMILASPVPYGITILGLTVAVRSAISLPAALWVRKRTRRLREVVMPEMKRQNDRLALEVFRQCKEKGVGPEEYMKELKKQVADSQYALHKKYKTHPMLTLAVPFITNIPILLITSLAIRQAVETPDTALVGQSLLWMKDITEPDTHGIIGILAGCLAFGSAELHGWRRRRLESETKAAAEPTLPTVTNFPTPPPPPPKPRTAAPPRVAPTLSKHLRSFSSSSLSLAVAPPPIRRSPIKHTAADRVPGAMKRKRVPKQLSQVLQEVDTAPGGKKQLKETTSLFQTIMGNGVRLWSIGIVGLALSQPAALVAYWVCSIAYTITQNLIFANIDEREDKARRLLKAANGADGVTPHHVPVSK